jgi:type III secretion protein U
MSDSEEKTLDASDKKLNDARKKGQVPRFADATTAAVLVTGAGLLLILLPRFYSLSQDMVIRTAAAAADPASYDPAPHLVLLGQAAATVVLPLFGALLAAVVLVTILLQKGIVFAVDPLTPKAENIDPVQGFKRLFGLRALSDLVKALVKLILVITCLAAILLLFGGDLLMLPGCGFDCSAAVYGKLIRLLVFAIVAVLVILAVLDIPVQSALFAREMKMSVTEQRREFKEMTGDPTILQERARLRHEDQSAPPARRAIERATLVILGDGMMAAYRYVPEEMGLPVLIARSRDPERTKSFLRTAVERAIPVYRDAALAADLQVGAAIGEGLGQEHFLPVARAMALARPL